MRERYKLRLPPIEPDRLNQDEAYCLIEEGNAMKRIRFHDYHELYRRPGLYEQLFYDRLKCVSPFVVADLLQKVVSHTGETFSQLRVLDVGAGNGIMGEALTKLGVARLVGIDILADAKAAAERDRPGLYDAYYAIDLCEMSGRLREELSEWRLNCMTTVAALGFGDIPAVAFREAYNLIDQNGWIAFNIKETFLDEGGQNGFSKLVKNLILTDHFDIHHMERYQHRLSIDGTPLYYYALVGRKNRNIDPAFLEKLALH